MTLASDTLPLSLAMVLATAAAIGSSPAARRTMATIDTGTLIGVVSDIGAAMVEGMPSADLPDAAAAPWPAAAPLLPLLRRGAHRSAP